ncbi:MAG TPA: trypsin-like peptidase domain-containing protein [Chloroflexota bacterium]|nr:trypsin-like peptidase domain-containing protein [Chloroflexota bacterium]
MAITEVNEAMTALVGRIQRSTVQIQSPRGGGAGVVWSRDGIIVTNAHVVAAGRAEVEAEGRVYRATIIGADRQRDLAALQIPATNLTPLPLAPRDSLRPGSLVIAVGHPLGASGAVSAGILHAADAHWVRADIRLLPGNSGGPLTDVQGRLIGINAMVAGGLGLAIPLDAVEAFLRQWEPQTEVA